VVSAKAVGVMVVIETIRLAMYLLLFQDGFLKIVHDLFECPASTAIRYPDHFAPVAHKMIAFRAVASFA